MSRAFVKETDAPALLPDRPIGPHPNPVTRRGLALIESELARYRGELAAAASIEDQEGIARAARELRYWTARRTSARLTEPAAGTGEVGFGTAVTLRRADGTLVTYRVVGEDEAEPAEGRISWVSPVARALRAGVAGDAIALPSGEVEVVRVDPSPEPAG